MAAWLLHCHGLDVSALISHTYWMNKAAGKKWCPAYIFGSTSHATALKNWKAFKATVQKYLEALNGTSKPAPAVPSGKLYCVQVGAFSKKNADAFKEAAGKGGVPGFCDREERCGRMNGAHFKKPREQGFSKRLVADIRGLLWTVTIGGLVLAAYCVYKEFDGALPWLSAMVGLPWAAHGVICSFYLNMAKSDHREGGVTFEAAKAVNFHAQDNDEGF